jgi:hypothetical protein
VDSNGKPKYIVQSTGLTDTGRGRELAHQILETLYFELYHGNGRNDKRIRMMSDLFEEFIDSKTRLPNTIVNYRLSYKSIVRGDYIPNEQRIEDDVKQFLRNTKLKPVSINSYLRQFKAFLSWLTDYHDLRVPKRVR